MIDIDFWIDAFLQKLKDTFGERVWFVGLQGSYGRGEATQTSDIDMVVILDELSVEDIKVYNALLDRLPHRELTCGFLSGKDEVTNWEPSDLFHLYYDTTPLKGSLDELLPKLDEEVVKRTVKIGVCNIFHGCVHNMLYEKSEKILVNLYKQSSFVVRTIAFLQAGEYVNRQVDLVGKVSVAEKEIVDTFSVLKNCGKIDFERQSEDLLKWAQGWIKRTK